MGQAITAYKGALEFTEEQYIFDAPKVIFSGTNTYVPTTKGGSIGYMDI